MPVLLDGNVEIPDDLLDAQESGNLVIFAGAGVSRPDPSSLPLFEDLVDRIGERHGRTRPKLSGDDRASGKAKEPLDAVLDKWAAEGIAVHQTCRELLTPPESVPCSLHHDSWTILRRGGSPRLVTTNFDLHFSEALGNREWTQYRAPALPPGNRFKGLVYLHGAVDQDPEDMVLTSSGFGRAYLGEGWARRFLVEMFSVEELRFLFVGYSFDDVIMSYLLRGTPRRSGVYVLTDQAKAERWADLSVVPIEYSAENHHQALRDAFSDWAERSSMSVRAHAQRIHEIASSTTPPYRPSNDASYLDRALIEESNVRFFASKAAGVPWVKYLLEHPTFATLFCSSDCPPATREFLPWITAQFKGDPHGVLEVLLSRKQLHVELWARLVDIAARDLPLETRRTCLALLLAESPRNARHITAHLRDTRDDFASFLLLFEHQTRPHARRPQLLDLGDSQPLFRYDVVLSGNEYWLLDSVNIAKGFLPEHADELARFAVARLEHFCRVSGASNPSSTHDPLSYQRQRIESRGPSPNDWEALLEVALESILALAKNGRDPLDWIDRLGAAGPPILRRLSFHLLRDHVTRDPKVVLDRLVSAAAWFDSTVKAEVFAVVRELLSKLNASQKDRLLASVLGNAPNTSIADAHRLAKRQKRGTRIDFVRRRRLQEYELYNFLVWLTRHDVHARFHAALSDAKRRNPDFEPRDAPDLDWSIGRALPAENGLTVAQLAEMDTSQLVAMFDKPEGRFGHFEMANVLARFATELPEKSYGHLFELSKRGRWRSRLWGPLLSGLAPTVERRDWVRLLKLLEAHQDLEAISRGFSRLLLETERSENESRLVPSELLARAQNLGVRVVAALPQEADALEHEGWATAALNHAAGRVAEFFVRSLSRQRASAGDRWRQIPDEARANARKLIDGNSSRAAMAQVIFVGELQFFFAVDQEWTRANLLPLLDWDCDPDITSRAWHGYLTWGRWDERILPQLRPLFSSCAKNISRLASRMQRRFLKHVAGISIYSTADPTGNGWLPRIVAAIPPELRATLAEQVFRSLTHQDITDDFRNERWNTWIGDYLESRCNAQPVSLSAEEARETACWALASSNLLRGIASLLPRFPKPSIEHRLLPLTPWLREGTSARVIRAAPEDFARLVLYFLQSMTNLSTFDAQALRNAIASSWEEVGVELRDALAEHALRLGANLDPTPSGHRD